MLEYVIESAFQPAPDELFQNIQFVAEPPAKPDEYPPPLLYTTQLYVKFNTKKYSDRKNYIELRNSRIQ